MTKCSDPNCGEEIFKDSTGAWQSERRVKAGTSPEGKERRASAPPSPAPAPSPVHHERPPKRAHWIHRKWFGLAGD